MSRWVDFKTVRESVDFGQVLRDYGVEVTAKGNQAMGFCPLPGHKGRSNAKSKSFSVNLDKSIFQCFGCQAKGNVLDFTAFMEGLDPEDPAQFRQAALILQERYLAENGSQKQPRESKKNVVVEALPEPETVPDAGLPRVINAPLNFELKKLDCEHPYFDKRGLNRNTVAHFAVGYCKQGLMKGRIAIPLHDAEGRLIGYAGRLVDEAVITAEEPKYRFPGRREKGGVVHEFHKSELVFNGYRIAGPVVDLIVVEGFFGVMWLYQSGYKNVVALMGSSCSESQSKAILRLVREGGRIWLMPDGDNAGEKCAHGLFDTLAQSRFVRWVRLPDGKQPEDFSVGQLKEILVQEYEV